jgi:hypothetical protein
MGEQHSGIERPVIVRPEPERIQPIEHPTIDRSTHALNVQQRLLDAKVDLLAQNEVVVTDSMQDAMKLPRAPSFDASFRRALDLATGMNQVGPPSRTVPVAQMQVARQIADAVYQGLKDDERNHPERRGYGGGWYWPVYVEALSAAQRLRDEATLGGASSAATEVAPLGASLRDILLSRWNVGYEMIEIVLGDVPVRGSRFGTLDLIFEETGIAIAEIAAQSVPVVGDLIAIAEFAFEKDLVGRVKPRSNADAMIIGIVVGARVAAIAVSSLRDVRRFMAVYDALQTTSKMTPWGRTWHAGEKIIALRCLTPGEFEEWVEIVRSIENMSEDARIPSAIIGKWNYLTVRMSDGARFVEWSAIGARKSLHVTTNRVKVPGLMKIEGAVPSRIEIEAGTALFEATGKPVLYLPKGHPKAYREIEAAGAVSDKAIDSLAGLPRYKNIKHPDLLFDGGLADIAEVTHLASPTKLGNLVKRKREQAGTVVLYLSGPTRPSIPEVQDALSSIWANPDFWGLEKVIILDGKQMREVVRPESYVTSILASVILRTAAAAVDTRRRVADQFVSPQR